MMRVKKKSGKIVQAIQLGKKEMLEEQLITEGKLRYVGDGYEVFSREILNREQKGERAYIGDYVKFDEAGCPYPNTKEFFEKNHHNLLLINNLNSLETIRLLKSSFPSLDIHFAIPIY